MSKRRKKHSTSTTQTFSFRLQEIGKDTSRVATHTSRESNGGRVTRDSETVRVPLKRAHDIDNERNEILERNWPVTDNDQHLFESAQLGTSAAEMLPEAATKPKPKGRNTGNGYATTEHDPALTEWTAHRDKFLAEILRTEGLQGHSDSICMTCRSKLDPSTGPYKCRDCFTPPLQCRRCCITSHRLNPFHRILKWDGQCFMKTSLKDCGLKIQLGHKSNETCASPAPGPSDFVVIHTNGFHSVDLYYCQCDQAGSAGSRLQQLLRAELYPATISEPTTASTFRLLEHFHVLTLQSKLTAYDYYLSLQMLIDHSGLTKSLSRQHAFLRMVREWRNLESLKRAGRGHDERGVAGTNAGELCIQCPACPVPDWNIPSNWHEVSDDLKFLYFTFVAVDANFRLKRRAISSESRDPSLASGWGYMVEDKEYRAHVAQHVDQQDMSSCAGFAALVQANTKYSKGYATTGVGMAIDSRHGFVLRNSVGDLQKGERYCNMDYIVASALSLLPKGFRGVLSYDIVCAWIKHWCERLAQLPEHLQVQIPQGSLRYAIPKYHHNAHREEDHNQYSLNLIPGAARTDGEEIERNWSRHDGIANSTREMGPGSRHDTLEDHFGFSNWKKYINMGTSLQKRLKEAQVEQQRLYLAFSRFKSERGLQPANVEQWTKEVVAWEHDPTLTDPYFIPPSGMTESDIRLQLAEEEDENELPSLHDMSPSSFITALLAIEDEQRRFRLKHYSAAGTPPTSTVEIVENRTMLRRKIASIRGAQAIYMPSVPHLLAARSSTVKANTRTTIHVSTEVEISATPVPELPNRVPYESRSSGVDTSAAPSPQLTARAPPATLLPQAITHDAPEPRSSDIDSAATTLPQLTIHGRPELRSPPERAVLSVISQNRSQSRAIRPPLKKSQNEAVLAEKEPLFFPSDLTPQDRELCTSGLADIEARLRKGQLRDALDKLRNQLHLKAALIGDRVRNVRHQAQSTRSQQRFAANEAKVIIHAEKYRAARSAILSISGHGEWETEWPVLEKADVCTMQQDPFDMDTSDADKGAVSEGRKTISWIWMSADKQGDGQKVAKLPGSNEALRVEFLKARARARRWTEEVLLLQEEQRRVLVSLEKTALAWEAKQQFATMLSCSAQQQGVRAYAAKQAAIQRGLKVQFEQMWAAAKRDKGSDGGDKCESFLMEERESGIMVDLSRENITSESVDAEELEEEQEGMFEQMNGEDLGSDEEYSGRGYGRGYIRAYVSDSDSG